MSLNTRNAPKSRPVTIKHNGRKYVVVHQSVTLKLIKRAGKVQWFTLEGGKEADVVRHKDFWAALEHYSGRQDALGITGYKLQDELLTDLTGLENRVEALANAGLLGDAQ